MRRLIIGLLSLALVLPALVEPARTQGTQPTGKPFRVAILVGLTGPTGPLQQLLVTGAQLAAKKLNAEGGILGRPVEITAFDHQFDPARAVRMLQDDVLTQNWDVIVPGGGSLTTLPMLPLVAKAKVLAYASLVTAIDPATLATDYPYFFSVLPSPLDSAAAFAEYISKLHVKKLAVLFSTDAYGVNTSNAYIAAVKKKGIPMVVESYDIATVDVTPTLLKLKAESPDRMFVVAFGSPAGHVLNSLDKLGWSIPVVGDVGMGTMNLTTLVAARAYANLTVQIYHINAYVPPEQRSARLKTFIAAVKANGPITQGLLSYAAGWDPIMLTALAAQQANSTDEGKMVEALEHLRLTERQKTYVTYSEYKFTPTNHVVYTAPQEYSFVPYTPLSDGMLGAP